MLSPGARRIVQEALREDVSVQELGEMANADPAFAVRVLSVANSAAYSRSRDVTNVQQACTLLGIRGLRNIALGMLVADLVPAAEGAASLLANCLRRALIAREIARITKLTQREDGFFAGLLLEVGLLHQACEDFEECLDVSRSPGRYRVTRERAAGLEPHPLLGARMARELSLPDALREAILNHHDPVKPEEPLSAVCWVAELCASVLEAGDESQNFRVAEAAAAQLGVASDELRECLERTPAEVNELSQALECPAGPPKSERVFQRPAEKDLWEMHVQYEELIAALERVMDDRDRLTVELDEATRALAQAGLRMTSQAAPSR